MKSCCHISSVHSAFDPRIFHKECVSLARAGYDVSVICQHDCDVTEQSVRIIHLGSTRSRVRRFLLLPWSIAVVALRENADVYHLHDFELLPVGLFLKFVARKCVVYDVHEDSPKTVLSRPWIPRWARETLSVLVGFTETRIARTFDCIVTATPHLKGKFAACRYVIDVRNYPRLVANKAPPREHSQPRQATLVYVGSLEEVRGIREIIMALGFLQPHHPVRLEIIGEFTEPRFEAEVTELPEWDHVDHLGFQRHEAIPARLAQAQVGLVCLHPLDRFRVSYPIKLFEYMAARIPVVASDFPLWRSIVEEADCGLLVDPLEPCAIAEAIRVLLDDPLSASALGTNGRTLVEHKYNWESEEIKLLAAYERILGASRPDAKH